MWSDSANERVVWRGLQFNFGRQRPLGKGKKGEREGERLKLRLKRKKKMKGERYWKSEGATLTIFASRMTFIRGYTVESYGETKKVE